MFPKRKSRLLLQDLDPGANAFREWGAFFVIGKESTRSASRFWFEVRPKRQSPGQETSTSLDPAESATTAMAQCHQTWLLTHCRHQDINPLEEGSLQRSTD